MTNDMKILLLNYLLSISGILFLYYNNLKICKINYVIYGSIILPILSILISFMGVASILPNEMYFIGLIFGIFYIPYVVVLTLPSITIQFFVHKCINEHYIFNKNYIFIEYLSYILFWMIIFFIISFFICKKNEKVKTIET